MTTSIRGGQFTAIADLRLRMFLNSLRSKRGKMELASRLLITLVFVVGGIGGFTVATGFAWYFVSQNNAEYMALLLWPIFFFWQLFPVMSTAFTNNPDSADLLRFPLTYRSYFLIRLAYGFFDPASALGTVALTGILLGTTIARPLLFPWALLVLFTFALFNLVLMQTVFTWLERWLAQRRTREIMAVLFILAMFSFQLIGPLIGRFGRTPHPKLRRTIQVATKVQAVLLPRPQRHRPNFPRSVPRWLHRAAFPGSAHLGHSSAAAPPPARSVSRRKSQRSGGAPCPGASPSSADGMEPARLTAVGHSRVRKGNALYRAQRTHAAHLVHAHPHAADLSPGTDEFPSPLQSAESHTRHGVSRRGCLRDPGPHQPGLQQFRRRRRRDPILLRLAREFSPDRVSEKHGAREHPHSEHRICLDRRFLSLRRPASGGLGCHAGGTSVRNAAELHRRQRAVHLCAEEARFFNFRPAKRLADNCPGKLRHADSDRGLGRRGLHHRASLR